MKAIADKWDALRINSVFFKLLLSFTLLIMIPIIGLGALSYIIFADTLEKEVQRYNNLVLNKTSAIIEQKAQELKNTMYQMVLQTNRASHDYQKIMEIEELLNRIKNANNFIDDIYVYYLDTNQIVSGNGLFDYEYYFRNRSDMQSLQEDEWRHILSERNNFRIMPTQNVKGTNGAAKNIITFLTSFPLYDTSINGTLVISVNEEKLLSIMNTIDPSPGESEIIIANSQLQPISSSNKTYFAPSESSRFRQMMKQLLPASEASFNYVSEIGDRQVMISYSRSTVTDWHYIVFTSLDSIIAPVKYIKFVTVAVCLGLFGIGLFAAVFISRMLARPIHEIVRFIKSENPFNLKPDRKTDELQYIYEHMHFVTDNNKHLERNAIKQHDLIQDYYVKSLLLGESGPDEQNGFGSLLRYPFYSVVIVDMEREEGERSPAAFVSLKDRILSFFESILIEPNRISGLVTHFGGGKLSILINYSDESVLLEKLCGLGGWLMKEPLPTGTIRVTAAKGSTYTEIQQMNKSYEEALSALLFRSMSGSIEVVEFMKTQHIPTSIDYSLEEEQQLLWHVMTGEADKVADIVTAVLNRNLNDHSPVEKGRKLYQAFENTIDKIRIKTNIVQDQPGFFTDRRPPSMMNKDAFQTYILRRFEQISAGFPSRKDAQNDELKQNILDFIHKNYGADLSLDRIADAFGLHPKYISRYFKEHVGVNFLEYLNRLRVDKAKELFRDRRELKVNQVADLVGMSNLNSFIGTFKKYEGTTPGKYKEHLSAKAP